MLVRWNEEELTLNVELPKREEAKPKAIPIGTGSPKSLGPGRKVA